MKTVISASRRTDIPAFYLDWFMQGIRAGTLSVQNPFYKKKIYEVNLKPDVVEWIVFWSRDYSNFLKKFSFFCDYRLLFHFTILSHHPHLENSQVNASKALKQCEKLAAIYTPAQIIWRYDPIVIWEDGDKMHTNYQRPDFEFLCSAFKDMGVSTCYFSFVTPYSKFLQRMRKEYPHCKIRSDVIQQQNILTEIKEIAVKYQIDLYSCCNDRWVDASVKKGRCVSGTFLNHLGGKKTVSEAKSPTRSDCGCTRSIDVGNYERHPCYFGCIYCYANPVRKMKNTS